MDQEKLRIIIVEDEYVTALELEDRLKAMGYQVIAVTETGEDAVNKAHELKPDLMLIDIKLKGFMDGIQAAELIKNKLNIPIIFLTAFADNETLIRAKKVTPYGYLLKPFDERELYTTIEMAINKHLSELEIMELHRSDVNMTEKDNTHIFISYAKEDLNDVLKIYEFLIKHNFTCWLDVKDLLPGQNWKYEIEKAIKNSKYFIACISENSVSKRGYVQAELKEALNVLDTIPDDDIFIIPIKINECKVPYRLDHLQWLEQYNIGWQDKLLKSLKANKDK